jgi:hypothetical protein
LNDSWAQSPSLSYYYNPDTELSWASCYLYQSGGSKQKIEFMSVCNHKFAPYGTEKYSKDVDVNGPIVFIGDGLVNREKNSNFSNTDLNGKVLIFCYDFPESHHMESKNDVSLEMRIKEAISMRASAIILFSYKEEYPALYLDYGNESDMAEIPIITIAQKTAARIFASAGKDLVEIFRKWEETGIPGTEELISKLELKIKGEFDKVETEHFDFRFRKELISEKEMKQIVEVNEKSVKYLMEFFNLNWKKSFAVYFRDYDSKKFYTLHSGSGLSCEAGTFMVHGGGVPNYGLAVHENAHSIINSNWGNSSSFMDEGIAKYAEACATDKVMNHIQTINYLKENKLFPLKDMVNFDIGRVGLETAVAYPASGSFVEFIVDSYGIKVLKELYILEGRSSDEKQNLNSWDKVLGKAISSLEKEWLVWLSEQFEIDEKFIQPYLNR